MNIPMSVLLNNLCSLFILMLVGFALVRLKLVPLSVTGPIATILMKASLPAMLFVSMIREFDKSYLKSMLIMLILSGALLLLFIFLSRPIARLLGINRSHTGVWENCITFSNNGFFGFPIVLGVLGETGLGLALIYNISQNLLMYSMGKMQVRRGTAGAREGIRFDLKKSLLTMINLSMLLGLVCYICELTPPSCIMEPLTYLSNTCTPLSMILIGIHIGSGSFKDTVCDRDAVLGTAAKLILMPLIAWGLLKLIPISDPLIAKVILLTITMPTASVASILSEEAGADSRLASRIVFFSTALSFITIPIICLLP